jgi:hypothetical protein
MTSFAGAFWSAQVLADNIEKTAAIMNANILKTLILSLTNLISLSLLF